KKNRKHLNEQSSGYYRNRSRKQKYKANQHTRKWRKENHIKNKKLARQYAKKRMKNLTYRIGIRISRIIWAVLRGKKNYRHWETLVGYTVNELKTHIESKFSKGMTWKLFLSGKIEIDHIIPLKLFTFKSDKSKQFKYCCSLKNLQPLWKKDNLQKNDILPDKRSARNLTIKEKNKYLKELGII
ncbi:MAG: hypothetical protein AABY22_19445, partial [Nanoarchaeota archaeon]